MRNELNLDELDRLAKAATPGPWYSAGGYLTARDPDKPSFQQSIYNLNEIGNNHVIQAIPFDRPDDAKFVAAFNPSVAQELIRRLREAEKDAARLDWFQENIVFHKPANYDGCDYGRFDIWWKSETNDLRDAIDAAIAKEADNGQS